MVGPQYGSLLLAFSRRGAQWSASLSRSDIAFVDKRYVRGPWRDGRGYSQWLFSFGDEANVRTQQSLRLKVDSAALAHSADMPKLQAHVDELLSNWCKIVGNTPNDPDVDSPAKPLTIAHKP